MDKLLVVFPNLNPEQQSKILTNLDDPNPLLCISPLSPSFSARSLCFETKTKTNKNPDQESRSRNFLAVFSAPFVVGSPWLLGWERFLFKLMKKRSKFMEEFLGSLHVLFEIARLLFQILRSPLLVCFVVGLYSCFLFLIFTFFRRMLWICD